MSTLLTDFVTAHGAEITTALAKEVKIDPQAAANLLPQAAPLVLAAIQKTMADPAAQQAIMGCLGKLLTSHAPDKVAGLVGSDLGAVGSHGGELLALLKEHLQPAVAGVAQNADISQPKAQSALMALAPVLLGYLAHTQGQGAGGLNFATLKLLVDKNGDGNILDDVVGFFGSQSSQPGGGLLGSLLGALGSSGSKQS